MKRKYKSKDFSVDDWGLYNKETGETMEVNAGKITLSTPTQQVMLSSNNYLYLDTDRLKILRENGISDIETGLLVLVSSNLAFSSNICMTEEGEPHTSLTIAQMLGQTQQSVNRKLKKLQELGLIKKTNVPGNKELGKVYIVNPYLLRRGKNFANYLSNMFTDIILIDKDTEKPLILGDSTVK